MRPYRQALTLIRSDGRNGCGFSAMTCGRGSGLSGDPDQGSSDTDARRQWRQHRRFPARGRERTPTSGQADGDPSRLSAVSAPAITATASVARVPHPPASSLRRFTVNLAPAMGWRAVLLTDGVLNRPAFTGGVTVNPMTRARVVRRLEAVHEIAFGCAVGPIWIGRWFLSGERDEGERENDQPHVLSVVFTSSSSALRISATAPPSSAQPF